jgi:DNA-binding NarL/FixJ family response regulator
MPIKVLIYDDNKVFRNSIKDLLLLENTFDVIETFSHPLNILHEIEIYAPDVILMDIDMPEMNGVSAVKKVREYYTDLSIIMLTVFEDNENIFNAICAGASGYILKKSNPETIANSIIDVLQGGAPMTSSVAKKVLQLFPKPFVQTNDDVAYNLSQREIELLQLLVKGFSYKMIAGNLFISIETVRTHIKNIYKKLHVNSGTEAVAIALNKNLV